MARVQLSSLGLGVFQDDNGTVQTGVTPTILDLGGNAAAIYADATTAAPTTATTDSAGGLVGYVEEGTYAITVGSQTKYADANSGQPLAAVNPRSFGAKGDGITNDTVALQAAINHAIATGGNPHIPPGTYKFSQITINVDALGVAQRLAGLVVKGGGRHSTLLVADGTQSPAINIISNTGSGGMAHVRLQDLQVYYTAAANMIAVQFWNVLHFSTLGCIFYADKCALSIQGSGNGTFIDTECYLSGPIPASPAAALWIGRGNTAPYSDNGTLTSPGPLVFIGGQAGSTNNVPAIIIEGDNVAYGGFGIKFVGFQYAATGTSVDAAVKIDGRHTTVALDSCYSESAYNTANSGSEVLIGSHAKPRVVTIRDHTAHGHGDGTSFQKYWLTVASCESLRVEGAFLSKQGHAHGYDSGIVHFQAGYPAASDLVDISGVTKDDVTGPLYADDNGVIPSTRTGSYRQRSANQDSFYAPQSPQFVAPYPPAAATGVSNPGSNTLVASRVIVPCDGILHGLTCWIGGTSGNIRLGVYDTGDALAGSRTRLYDSGSVAASAGGTWQTPVDPNLTVKAGQQLDLALIADNATITFGRIASFISGSLPTSYWPATGGALPKLYYQSAPGGFLMPATITEANCNGLLTNAYLIIARVTPT